MKIAIEKFWCVKYYKAQPYNMEHTLCVGVSNGVFEVIWENSREPFENIDYSVIKTFTDFKKVFTEITDEGKLKEIYDDQKKQDRELVYKPIEDEKTN